MTGHFVIPLSYLIFGSISLGSHISIDIPNSGHYLYSFITLDTTTSSSNGFKLQVLYVTYP